MKIFIEELEVIFPYQFVYNEQEVYMTKLKQTLDQTGHAILEMPTGTGKTVSLLALILAYLSKYPDRVKKLVYCTRTVVEMEKTLQEVKFVMKARQQEGAQDNFLAVGLTSRRNLCIHPEILAMKERDKVDSECRKRTAEWVINNRKYDNSIQTCDYFLGYQNQENFEMPPGVYSLDDLREHGAETVICPYFMARKLVGKANIIVYNYLYLIDPNVASQLAKEHQKESVVVFDEAHNIDDVCIEAFTVRLNKPILLDAVENLNGIENKLSQSESDIQQRLAQEYQKLIENLEEKQQVMQAEGVEKLKKVGIPPQIRQAKHFIDFMKRVVFSLKKKLQDNSQVLKEKHFVLYSTKQFAEDILKEGSLDRDSLKSCGERLQMLLNTLQISEIDRFTSLGHVTQFVGLLVQYTEGFKVIFQTNVVDGNYNEKLMTLACFDSSLAMKYIFTTFQSVILTSGTMSPLDMYPRMLDFKPVVCCSIDIDLARNSIQPLIVTMAEDGTELTSEFTMRNNEDVSRNYGNFLLELSENVPDGLIVFMPSYSRMEEWARVWEKDRFLEQIAKNKLLFIESKDVAETSLKIAQFRNACDVGRGGALFSIARGKIAEGIDFEQHYGRCVAVVGFPALNSKDILILERCSFLQEKFQITKNDFIEFDAMRQTCQCLGRVMRGKMDYGIMIMCDKRFAQKSKLNKMPKWIAKQLEPECVNITSETAIGYVRQFFRKMAQKFVIPETSYKK